MDKRQAFIILEMTEEGVSWDIKAQYKKLAMVHHPDRGGNAEVFKLIQEAYEFLMCEKPDDMPVFTLVHSRLAIIFENEIGRSDYAKVDYAERVLNAIDVLRRNNIQAKNNAQHTLAKQKAIRIIMETNEGTLNMFQLLLVRKIEAMEKAITDIQAEIVLLGNMKFELQNYKYVGTPPELEGGRSGYSRLTDGGLA